MNTKFPAAAAFSDKAYTPIAMALVESNQVACIGYDAPTKTLAVQFRRGLGHIYHYPDVEQETFDAFMTAESKSGFFKEHIKALAFDKFPAPEARGGAVPNPGVEPSDAA